MLLDALTGWTLFGGLFLALGSVVGRWIIVPGAFGGGDSRAHLQRRRSAEVGLWGALLVLAGLALYLIRQTREFRDPFAPLSEDITLLMSTPWGSTWITAAIAAVLLAASMKLAHSGRAPGWWMATALALSLALFPGLTGHASAADDRVLALALDLLHVWAAGAWMGGLSLVLYLETRARHSAEATSILPKLVPVFSPVALAAVSALIVTGLYASWTHLESVGALITTSYGRVLSIKLLLVLLVLGLGGRNFRLLTPRLGSDAGDTAMRRSAAAELAIAQLVLIVTAVLVRTSPMAH